MEFYKFSGYAMLIIGILSLLIGYIDYSNGNDKLNDLETEQAQSNRSPSENEQAQYRDALREGGEGIAQCIFGVAFLFGGTYMIFHQKGNSKTVPKRLPPPPYIKIPPVPPGMTMCPYCQAVIRMEFVYCPNCRKGFQ